MYMYVPSYLFVSIMWYILGVGVTQHVFCRPTTVLLYYRYYYTIIIVC